jgi:RecA-family ATPase
VSENNYKDMKLLIDELQALARRTRCDVILTHHNNKSRGGSALNQSLGSTAITHVPRSVLRVDPHPEQEGRRVLSVVACNQGKHAPSLAFDIEGEGVNRRIVWRGESSLTADQLAEAQDDSGERDARGDAKTFLREELESGPKPAATLIGNADNNGIKYGTLRRAKRDLGVTSHPVGPVGNRYFEWRKPANGWPKDDS